MKRARPTLKDVAKAAGVSVGTASDALSGRGRMTDATRRKVEEAASSLGYVANPLAAGLRTGRTNALGLHHQNAYSRLDTPYFRNFLAGALSVAQSHDYDLAVLSSDERRPRRTAPRVDGVIVVDPIADDLRARELMGSGFPVVAGEHVPAGMPQCAIVAADHTASLHELLSEAEGLGSQYPVLLAPDENSGWGSLLVGTFEQWCRDRGVEGRVLRTPFGESMNARGFYERFAQLLEAFPQADYVVASGSYGVQGAVRALEERGRTPGREVRLACTSSGAVLDVEGLPVSTVDLPARRLGEECARRLIWMLDEGGDPAEAAQNPVLVPAQVLLRN